MVLILKITLAVHTKFVFLFTCKYVNVKDGLNAGQNIGKTYLRIAPLMIVFIRIILFLWYHTAGALAPTFYCNSSQKKYIFLFSYLCVNNRNLQEINWFFTWFQNGRFKCLALILILNIIMSVSSFFFCIRFNNLEANS